MPSLPRPSLPRPSFRFLLSADRTPLAPGDPLWEVPLPTTRAAAGGMSAPAASLCSTDAGAQSAVTYGAYFSAVAAALGGDAGAALCSALSGLGARSKAFDRIEAVEIQLLKHGHFYHPSRLTVMVAGAVHHLALNVALTADGIALLPKEVAALESLAQQPEFTRVPRVLAKGSLTIEGDRRGQWFLVPWFEGYHEFHLTRRGKGRLVVTVWQDSDGSVDLNVPQTGALLEDAARVLGAAVNPHTLAHIFPWHHGAGDFVVGLDDEGRPRARLITVRGYPSLVPSAQSEEPTLPSGDASSQAADGEASLERLLYALLLLIVQASLRLRVDRLDGVGDIVLHPVAMVAPICRGLIGGLDRMRARWQFPAALDGVLRDYLRSLSADQIRELNQAIQGGFAAASPERSACAPHLDAHALALHQYLQTAMDTR